MGVSVNKKRGTYPSLSGYLGVKGGFIHLDVSWAIGTAIYSRELKNYITFELL